MKLNRKVVALTVAIALSHAAGMQAAQAAMIATDTVASASADEQVASRRAQILSTLSRADVAQALVEKGVDMGAARARIDALSDAEVLQLADQIEQAPAGGTDVLGAIVLIFLVLLITDILGLTKVFPFTRSIRR